MTKRASSGALFGNDLLQVILDSMSESVNVCTEKGFVVFANTKTDLMFGYDPGELLGKPVDELTSLAPGRYKALTFAIDEALQKHGYWEGDCDSRRKDGSTFRTWTRISGITVNGKAYRVRVQREQTDSEELQRQLEQSRITTAQNARLAALGQMAAGVAHEINNPLAIISASAQALQRKQERNLVNADVINSTLEMVIRGVDRISKIVKGLRSIARDEAGEPMRVCSLREIIEDVLSVCYERFKNHGIEFELRDNCQDATIYCRPYQIGQILINLLNNADHAVHDQTVKKIKLEVAADLHTLTLAISDSGSGIGSDIAEQIFDPFFTTKSVGTGTGLGLSISKEIAQQHDGQLWLDRSSSGTRFVLALPIAATQSKAS